MGSKLRMVVRDGQGMAIDGREIWREGQEMGSEGLY